MPNKQILINQELIAIVGKCEAGFKSNSWKQRKWTAFKAAIRSGHIQRFRESLTETKSTLTLALLHQWFVKIPFIFAFGVYFYADRRTLVLYSLKRRRTRSRQASTYSDFRRIKPACRTQNSITSGTCQRPRTKLPMTRSPVSSDAFPQRRWLPSR